MTTSYLIHHQPPTTNHNLLIAGWKKHVWKKPPFFEAYTKAHKWRHLLENCPTPGNSWSGMHLVEKASAKSWLVFAGSPNTRNISFCKENSFRRSDFFLTCTRWFKPWPNSIPPVGGHFSNLLSSGHGISLSPKKVTDKQNWRVFLVFFYYKLSTKVFHLCWRKDFFPATGSITHGFSRRVHSKAPEKP